MVNLTISLPEETVGRLRKAVKAPECPLRIRKLKERCLKNGVPESTVHEIIVNGWCRHIILLIEGEADEETLREVIRCTFMCGVTGTEILKKLGEIMDDYVRYTPIDDEMVH